MPHLEEWHAKYANNGLTIIGVHAPEFDFEREPDNVRWAIERFGIEYPVVLDNHFKIWHAYANSYWPRKYLVLNGKIIYDHVGEGDYRETEMEIREALAGINPNLDLTTIPVEEEPALDCRTPTPETYLGYSRGTVTNPGGLRHQADVEYDDEGVRPGTGPYIKGRWRSERQYLEHAGDDAGDYLVLPFQAVSVNLVLTPGAHGPVAFDVEFDGAPLTADVRGDDVDGSGVLVREPRMYNLFRASRLTEGSLKLTGLPDGIRLYAFSFGGCIGIP